MSKIKTKVVYHEADLDGVTSAAVMLLDRNLKDEDIELIPYDYHKDFNQKLTNGHEVYMIDVSLKIPKMFEVSKAAAEFYLVDHHISFYENLISYCQEHNIELKESSFGISKKIEVPEYNFIYFYASHISACELAMNLYCPNIGPAGKELVNILGQYDTWRLNGTEKSMPYDQDWNDIVLPIQYSLRSYMKPETICRILYNLDNGGTKYNKQKLIEQGKAILAYIKTQNSRSLHEYSFNFEYDNIRFLCMNTTNFNSTTFDEFWNENLYDAMMAFNFTGKDWKISLYTTKTETVDILKIAKFFGGGGHKGACGFRIPHNQLLFRKNKLEFGMLTLLDVNMLPQNYKGVDVNDILKEIKLHKVSFVNSNSEDNITVFKRGSNLKLEEKSIEEIFKESSIEIPFEESENHDSFSGKDFNNTYEPVYHEEAGLCPDLSKKEGFDMLMPKGPNNEDLVTPIILGTSEDEPIIVEEKFEFVSEDLVFNKKEDEPEKPKDIKADKPEPKPKAKATKKLTRNTKKTK